MRSNLKRVEPWSLGSPLLYGRDLKSRFYAWHPVFRKFFGIHGHLSGSYLVSGRIKNSKRHGSDSLGNLGI